MYLAAAYRGQRGLLRTGSDQINNSWAKGAACADGVARDVPEALLKICRKKKKGDSTRKIPQQSSSRLRLSGKILKHVASERF